MSGKLKTKIARESKDNFSREKQLEIICNVSNDIISLISVEPGTRFRFSYVNNAFLTTTDLKKEQVEGQYVDEIIPQPSRSIILAKFKGAMLKRRLQWDEMPGSPDARKNSLESITPVFNENGECTMLVNTVHEITNIQEDEREDQHVRHMLKERIKELTTLYGACQILQDEAKQDETALQELVSILPAGWQYPDITEGRIVAGDKQFTTPGYRPGCDSQSAEFSIGENDKGIIEVIYTEKVSKEVEGPFLAEERNLINMLAEMLTNYFTRIRITIEKKILEQEILNQKVEEQKKITRAVLNGQENERNKIGQELHDNVNQILVGAKMYLGLVSKEKPGTRDLINQSIFLIDSAINEIRALTRNEVTPPRKIGLKSIIQSLVDNTNEHSPVKTEFVCPSDPFVINDDLKLNIYRIIQEAINNVLKHAEAKNVMVVVESENEGIHIIIKDDGKGFDSSQTRSSRGIGISNMLNRVESYNGRLSIDGNPRSGCRIDIKIPV